MNKLEKIQNENVKQDIPEFSVGDNIRVDLLIVEAGKERVQAFTGTVIARRGTGISETVTVRRVSYGQGVERVIPLNSPRVSKIEVVRRGDVKRSKLYYLRNQIGRRARVREKKAN